MQHKITIYIILTFLLFNSCKKEAEADYTPATPIKIEPGPKYMQIIHNQYMYQLWQNPASGKRRRLRVYNIQNAANPILIQDINASYSDNVKSLFIYDEHLYLRSDYSATSYSLAIPESPERVGSNGFMSSCTPILFYKTYMFASAAKNPECGYNSSSLDLIDISNKSRPNMVKSYSFEDPRGMAIKDQLMYLCDGVKGLLILDISNPLNIQVLRTLDSIKNTFEAKIEGNTLFLNGSEAVYQYDCSDPLNLVLISKIEIEQ